MSYPSAFVHVLIDLSDASATLTRDLVGRWRQKTYDVEFDADGQFFYTFIKDQGDTSRIHLEERSKGFQWFFSFDLRFMHESKGTFENCVLLLDEPGLHLHPEAQEDFLERLVAYSEGNTLVYTTHLPFMIDLRKPDRIRVISESQEGCQVTDDLTQSQPEGKFVLQSALGIAGRQSYLVSQRNLVVEGVDDYWVITELSNLLIRNDKAGLPEDLFITPCGGASEVAYISTFMIGQKLDVVVLLDSDRAGDQAEDSLVKKWLDRYHDHKAKILRLGSVCQQPSGTEFATEDLFPDAHYLQHVQAAYSNELAGVGNPTLTLQGNGMLVKRVERALADIGITYNKGRVAKRIRRELSRMKLLSELPAGTEQMATDLITAINSELPSL